MQAAGQQDLFSLFRSTVAMIDAAEESHDQVTMEIGYATTDAILDKAIDIAPMNIENVLHRLGCARHLLTNYVYDLCCDEEGAEEFINKMEKLLKGAAEGLRMLHQVDMEATRLNYYLPTPRQASN
ncbi:hypothetical protein M8037_22120 [Sinorhizobium meliloti]|uniref:hypothetical protein n=1 Tax=Rhizobium meliloti TaxID=382 RepID=UPI002072A6AB|nr:hypothetical protein [Sinorhizobium meliloti]MCM5691424.1 hypothetical protein [Sinorhizobium meliloti]